MSSGMTTTPNSDSSLYKQSSREACTEPESELERCREQLEDYYHLAENLRSRIKDRLHIPGMNKLLKKCESELNFLNKVIKEKEIKACYVNSTNLTHIEGVLSVIESIPNVLHVLQPFTHEGSERPVEVDVVCNYGYTWIKVIARNPQALHRVWSGAGQFGEKSVLQQAEMYLSCAATHHITFKNPQVLFVFTNGIPSELARSLESSGVSVFGKRLYLPAVVDTDGDSEEDEKAGIEEVLPPVVFGGNQEACVLERCQTSSPESDLTDIHTLFVPTPDIKSVNLDVTTLICLVSNVCHGKCYYKFKEKVLTQQAEWERREPLLPKLHGFMKDKQLFACETALNDFKTIIQTIGGPNESRRAAELLGNVHVVPDDVSERVSKLQCTHKIKKRAKVIFGCGDKIKAITMSANSGFIRSAANQGFSFAVFLHEARALTEQKEEAATPVSADSTPTV